MTVKIRESRKDEEAGPANLNMKSRIYVKGAMIEQKYKKSQECLPAFSDLSWDEIIEDIDMSDTPKLLNALLKSVLEIGSHVLTFST